MMTEILNTEDTQFVLFMGIMSPENESGGQRTEAPHKSV